MTDVKTVKQWLRVRNKDFRGWTFREMTLLMTGSDDFHHNPVELHDDYQFERDATVLLQLSPADDSNDSSNNADNDNDNNHNDNSHNDNQPPT